MRHETNLPGGNTSVYDEQKIVNKTLIELAKETNVKIIATEVVQQKSGLLVSGVNRRLRRSWIQTSVFSP